MEERARSWQPDTQMGSGWPNTGGYPDYKFEIDDTTQEFPAFRATYDPEEKDALQAQGDNIINLIRETLKPPSLDANGLPPRFNENAGFLRVAGGAYQGGFFYPMDEYALDILDSRCKDRNALDGDISTVIENHFAGLRDRYSAAIRRNIEMQLETANAETQEVRRPRLKGLQTEPEIKPGDHQANYQRRAMELVRQTMLNNYWIDGDPEFEVYVVWFCKTLQNWKALVGTTLADALYFEVTHNGDKSETYVDVYKKIENVTVYE